MEVAPVIALKDESPVILVPLKVIAARAAEIPAAPAIKANEVINAMTLFPNALFCLFMLIDFLRLFIKAKLALMLF